MCVGGGGGGEGRGLLRPALISNYYFYMNNVQAEMVKTLSLSLKCIRGNMLHGVLIVG